jgi:hypothetical protein
LKKDMVRAKTHRYTLRFKTRKTKEEEEGHQKKYFFDSLLETKPV